jgi:hypothetical protein
MADDETRIDITSLVPLVKPLIDTEVLLIGAFRPVYA